MSRPVYCAASTPDAPLLLADSATQAAAMLGLSVDDLVWIVHRWRDGVRLNPLRRNRLSLREWYLANPRATPDEAVRVTGVSRTWAINERSRLVRAGLLERLPRRRTAYTFSAKRKREQANA